MALISLKDLISVSNNGLGLPIDIRQQVDEYINIFDLYQCYPGMRIYVKYDSTSKALTYSKGIYIVKSIYSGTGKPNLVEFIEDYLHISDKVNKPSDTPTKDNFVSFDENGNIVDSGNKASNFAPIEQAVPIGSTLDVGKILEKKVNGFVWSNKPKDGKDGDDAYGVYEKEYKELHSGSTDGMLTRLQWLASLKGDKGDNAVNPFKGWLTSTSDLPENPHVGDYAYIEEDNTTYVYRCTTEGTWPQSSDEEKEPSDAAFATAQLLNNVRIDDTHLVNSVGSDEDNNPTLAKAEDVMQLEAKLEGITANETKCIPTIVSGYKFENGVIAESTEESVAIIDVSTSKRVRFYGFRASTSTNYGYGFYDISNPTSSDTPISYKTYDAEGSNNNWYKEYLIDVPLGAVSLVVMYKKSSYSSNDTRFYCYLQNGENVVDIINKAVNSDKKLMKVVINSNEFYVRTRFSDSEDIIILFKERILAGTAKGSQSLTLNSYYISNNKWSDKDIMKTLSSTGNPPDDLISPIHFIGFGPMTGQHGWSIPAVSRTGLTITDDDLNSIWCDANDTDRTFVLGYMTSTHLFFFPVVTNDNGIYGTTAGTIFSNLPVAFNHVEGATHTDTINKQSIRYDLRVESSKWSYLVDNYIVKEGTYYCDDFTFIESVIGYNPSNVNYADWFINPSDNTKYNDDIFILLSRAFVFKGSSFGYNLTMNPVYPFKIGAFRLVQPMLPIAMTENNITYHANIFVPKAKGITAPYINDDGIGSSNSKYRRTSDLYNMNDLPDRAICFLKSDNNEYKLGMAGGFSLTHGMTTKNVRNTLVKNEETVCYFGNGSSSKNKFYPSLLGSGDFENSIMPTSFIGQMNGYICWFNPNDNPGLQVYTYKDIDGYVVYIHGQEIFDKKGVNLPNYLEGFIVDTVVEKTNGASLLSSQVINGKIYIKFEQNDAISYSVNDNYIVLKICETDNDELITDDTHLTNPVEESLAKAKDVKERIIDVMTSEITDFNYSGEEELLQDVASYIVDKNGVLFALLKTDGSIVPLVKNADQKRIDSLLDMVTSESPYNDENVLKYLTDENNICFGKILKDGTVVIEKAYIGSLETKDGIQDTVSEKTLSEIVGLLSLGLDNIELSNNPRLWKVLGNIITSNGVFLNAQNENNLNIKPCISIIDDDTVDNQIPSSFGSSTPTTNTGGYFSVLFPLILSLSAKYNKKYSIGLACEGHRVGLTPFRSSSDEYSALNENGQAVKWLHDNMGWNVFNHSMTAQLPYADRTFVVENINSEKANTILSNGYYASKYAFNNTMVLELSTGKWYEVNSTKTAWVERTPTKKYAQLYYHDYPTGSWHFNRNFDFDYSWGEWFKRAKELGLPFERLIVHNGGTTSPHTIAAGRKYAYASIRTTGTYNNPPLKAAINRVDGDPSGNQSMAGQGLGYNVFDTVWFDEMKSRIDKSIADNSWIILMTHTNDQEYFRNYYLSDKSYPDKDDNYSSDWIIPLNHTEIQELITGQQDYVNNPPQRLGINSWDEWYPAPGTHLNALYQVLEYAIDNGVDLVSPWEEYLNRGNILNLGVDKNGQSYSYTTVTPLTTEEKSFLTIGADMSIRYYNSNNN